MPGSLFNACHYLLDRHVEQGQGGRTALRSGGTEGSGGTESSAGTEVSYAQLQELSAAFAGGLAALSTRRGERVLFVCSDRVELAVGLLGCWRFGAVAVPVSTMLTGSELRSIVVDSGARVLVLSPEFVAAVEVVAADAPDLAHVVTVAGAAPTVPVPTTGWDALLSGPGLPVAVTGPDTPALWLYTSGTTGSPKGAMHRHANLRAVCETYARSVLAITADDVCFSVAKLFFAYGLGNSLLFPLSVGACAVLEPRRPTPQVVAETMAAHAPTLFFAAPTFYAALVSSDLPADTFTGVRQGVSAGEAFPAALLDRFTGRFGLEVLDGLGSTEALHIFLSNHHDDVRPGTSGTAVEGYQLQLRDDEGALVEDETPGQLFVRGASLASGYWCRTEASRTVFVGEWVRTGDTYTRSADGFYTCLGRSGDLLKAGGIWVSPAEVEERLLQHKSVAEVAVVGVPDAHELDKPVAFVVAAPGAQVDADELVRWCRDGLAAFKRPRSVLVVDELPRTATGKVQRFRLRERAVASPATPAPDPVLQSL